MRLYEIYTTDKKNDEHVYIYASILLCNVLYMYWAFDTKVKFNCIILSQLRNTVAWTILKVRKRLQSQRLIQIPIQKENVTPFVTCWKSWAFLVNYLL